MPVTWRYQRIERCTGTGRITKDGLTIGEAHYVFELYRRVAVGDGPGPDDEAHAATRVRIRLSAPTFARTPLALSRAIITLHLEDGRQASGVLKGNALVVRQPDGGWSSSR
jgi:hypothetical protein